MSLIPISGFAASNVTLPGDRVEATVGQPCTLTVPEIPGDDGTLIYQWKDKDGSPIGGATESSYTFTLTSPSQSYFTCEISAGSSVFYYNVSIAQKTGLHFVGNGTGHFSETIDVQPGQSVTLNMPAVANSDPNFPITCNWIFDRGYIATDTTSYTIPSISPETYGNGLYSANIISGDDMISYSVSLRVSSSITLNNPQNTTYYYNPGDTVVFDATATSSCGDVSYCWTKGSPNTTVLSTNAKLTLQDKDEPFERNAIYVCAITDGYHTEYFSFYLFPEEALSTETNIPASKKFTVLPGENLTISGTVTLKNVIDGDGFEPENPASFLLQKYADSGSFPQNNWWSDVSGIPLDYCAYQLEKQIVLQGNDCIIHFTYRLDGGHPEIIAGKYQLQIQTSEPQILTFDVDCENYQTTVKESDSGIKIEGSLHPGAELAISTVDNTIFQSALDKGDEIIWSGNISLITQGDSAAYDGALTLSIPVGEKYNGRTLTILHVVDGNIETIKGIVENGLLKFNTSSLSPFAVVDANPGINGSDPSLPKTGDGFLALPLLVIAALALLSGILLNKKKQ